MGSKRTIGALMQAMQVPANSDYYPFVDLNAPRARYLRQTAIALPSLTVLPLPFLELLGGAVPPDPTMEPPIGSALFRDGLVRRAVEIRDAFARDDLNGLDPVTARSLSRLITESANCASGSGEAEWLAAIKDLSDATASYLSSEELARIWQHVEASSCYQQSGGESRQWADLLAAIAHRDAAAIERLGPQLLAAPAGQTAQQLAYLTVATVAACVRAGDLEQGRQVLETQWPRARGSGKFLFALRDLAALTGSAVR
jgi:hypothetical protein